MALTRKLLSSFGIEADQIDQIIEAHSETVNALKTEIASLKDEAEAGKKNAEELKSVQKEFADYQKKVEAEAKEREGKDYDKLLKEYNDYKAEQERKAVRAEKEEAYKQILKDAGIPEKHYAKILKYSDVDGVELDDKGKITTAKEILKEIKEEWSDHIEKEQKKGADSDNPPEDKGGGGKGGMTKEEIMQIKDRTERQKAIDENLELFGY